MHALRAAFIRSSGLVVSHELSHRSSSSPVTAFVQHNSGGGSTLHSSGEMAFTIDIDSAINSLMDSRSILLVENVPYLPSANNARLSELSPQCVILSTSALSVATRSSMLLLSVTRALSAPYSSAVSRQYFKSSLSSNPIMLFSSYCEALDEH